MAKISAAAVIAALSLTSSAVLANDDDDNHHSPPPPSAPQPAALNADPNVHWFAAWDEVTAPGSQDFYPTPTTYKGIGLAQTALNGAAAAGKPLGIKVEKPLSSSDAAALFNTKYQPTNRAISYIFADFEQPGMSTVINNTLNLVNQVRGSSWSKNAYVGQYGLYPRDNEWCRDDRWHHPYHGGPGGSKHYKFDERDYKKAKVNMANPSLYPGEYDFRNRSTKDWANQNIRTGLFVAPIGLATDVQLELNEEFNGKVQATGLNNHKQIGWVARFNNAGNPSLDTDNNSSNGYKFIPGAPLPQAGLSGAQTANQMMGRGDFSAQILHYRMRGMYSVNLFHETIAEGSVVGYTRSMAEQDVRDGWYNHSWNGRTNNIFNAADNKTATMTYNPVVDGTSGFSGNRSEQTGTIWSGQYSLSLQNNNSTNKKGALDILVSNLDTVAHMVKFGSVDVYDVFCLKNAQGYVYADSNSTSLSKNFKIEAGMHKLLQFDLVKTRVYKSQSDCNSHNNKYTMQTIWLLNQQYSVFTNNNRNEHGIPEPTTFGTLAAAGSLAAICRRQRKGRKA